MFAINSKVEGYETVNDDNVIDRAISLRTNFPAMPRVIGIEKNTILAVAAAYKTASGISEGSEVLTDNIYKASKLEIAMLIAKHDRSWPGFYRAAYELARDAFITGDVDSKAAALAEVTGRAKEDCLKAINKKLQGIQKELAARTNSITFENPITPESAEAVSEKISTDGGRYLLKLPTGYGKTKDIIEPAVRRAIGEGKKVLVVSHRRSINSAICLDIEGMVSYDECTFPKVIANAKGIRVVINSISAEKFTDFLDQVDVVIVDEATQVIAHILGGEVKNRQAAWEALDFVVKKAGTVVFADADIDSRCVEMIGPDHIVYSVERDHSGISIKTAGLDQVRAMAIESAIAGENVLIAIDGAKAAKALAATISKKTGVEALVITSENSKWKDQAAFIVDPNATSHKVVIYSPVITSSLSITSGHFTKHFGLFSGQVVPSDAIQMLRRDRTATEFVVGLKTPEYSKQEQLEATHVHADAPTARTAIETASIDQGIKEGLLAALDFDIKPSAFDAERYRHLQNEAWLKDGIQNTLPATLIMQGFKVEVLKHDDEQADAGFKAGNHGRKAVNRRAVKMLLTVDPKATKGQKVMDAGSDDEQELFEVIRARAEEVIGRTIDKQDAWLWKEGEGEAVIKRFRKLYVATDTTDEGKALVTLKEAAVAMRYGKDWTSEKSTELFGTLNADRGTMIRLGMSIGKAATAKAKQAAVTKWMSQIGLKTKKINGGEAKGYYYIVTASSYEQMLTYVPQLDARDIKAKEEAEVTA